MTEVSPTAQAARLGGRSRTVPKVRAIAHAATWTVIRYNGPDHLGLWVNADGGARHSLAPLPQHHRPPSSSCIVMSGPAEISQNFVLWLARTLSSAAFSRSVHAASWTVLRHDGPDHLGLRVNADGGGAGARAGSRRRGGDLPCASCHGPRSSMGCAPF